MSACAGGKANTVAQPEGAGAGPVSAQIETDFQDGENQKTNLAQLGDRAESDHRGRSGNSLGDAGGGNQPAGMDARPVQTEVSNAAETESERSDFPAGSGNRPVAPADADLQSGGRLAVGGKPDSLSATLARLGTATNFDAATFTQSATSDDAVSVVATRGKSPVTSTKQTVATRGKSRPVVEAVKASKGTWQFRLRWNSEPGRPVHYVATVADSTYEMIRKGDYEGYKKALIADYEASAVSAD